MSSRTKTPEEWIQFLLTLIEYTKDFKPDWEQLARDTGLYKRGKFVQQAYNGLKKKYAAGQSAGDNHEKPKKSGAIPKTPGARVTKPGAKPGMKRKFDLFRTDDQDSDEKDDLDELDRLTKTKRLKMETAAGNEVKDEIEVDDLDAVKDDNVSG